MNEQLVSTAMERTYQIPGGTVTFRSPAKRSVDVVMQMADRLSRQWGSGVVDRACRTMRLRMYIRRLEVGGFVRQFDAVDGDINQARGDTDRLMSVCESIRSSMDFMPESLYCQLDERARRFRDELRGGQATGDGLVQANQADMSLESDAAFPDAPSVREWVEQQKQERDDI